MDALSTDKSTKSAARRSSWADCSNTGPGEKRVAFTAEHVHYYNKRSAGSMPDSARESYSGAAALQTTPGRSNLKSHPVAGDSVSTSRITLAADQNHASASTELRWYLQVCARITRTMSTDTAEFTEVSPASTPDRVLSTGILGRRGSGSLATALEASTRASTTEMLDHTQQDISAVMKHRSTAEPPLMVPEQASACRRSTEEQKAKSVKEQLARLAHHQARKAAGSAPISPISARQVVMNQAASISTPVSPVSSTLQRSAGPISSNSLSSASVVKVQKPLAHGSCDRSRHEILWNEFEVLELELAIGESPVTSPIVSPLRIEKCDYASERRIECRRRREKECTR